MPGKSSISSIPQASVTRLIGVTEWTQKQQRARTWLEIAIVLGLSLGSSAVYSIVSLIRKLSTPGALNAQKAVINQPLSDQPIFDLVYQLLGIFFGLVPVVLVFWLLAKPGNSAFTQLGFNVKEPGKDLLRGFGLAAIIGIPGLGLYLVGNTLGITVTIVPTALDTYWWTVPVLVLAALRAALVEELIVVGYLFTRLREFGWKTWQIILTSAALRGSYHLYQGFGPFVGNFVMGVVFGLAYQRWGRTMPLVIAHWILDIVSFTGYAAVKALAPGFLPGT
jgi:uncharacterized protein